MRAYVSAKHCGLSLVLSKETRATLTACCVDRAMGTSVGAGLASDSGCGLNQVEGSLFRREPARCSRANTTHHSKPNLARLYGGVSNGPLAGSGAAVVWPRTSRRSHAR